MEVTVGRRRIALHPVLSNLRIRHEDTDGILHRGDEKYKVPKTIRGIHSLRSVVSEGDGSPHAQTSGKAILLPGIDDLDVVLKPLS